MLWKMVAVVNAVVLLGAFVAHEAGLWSFRDSPATEASAMPADEPGEIVIDVPISTEVDPNTSASWGQPTGGIELPVLMPGSKSSVKMPPVMLGGSKSRAVATSPITPPSTPPSTFLPGSKSLGNLGVGRQATEANLPSPLPPPVFLLGSKSAPVATLPIVTPPSPPIQMGPPPNVKFFGGSKSAPILSEEILMEKLLAHAQRIETLPGSVPPTFAHNFVGTSASWQPASMLSLTGPTSIGTVTVPAPTAKPRFFSGSKSLAPSVTTPPPKMLPGSKSFNPNAVPPSPPPAKQQRLLPGSKSEEVARPQTPAEKKP